MEELSCISSPTHVEPAHLKSRKKPLKELKMRYFTCDFNNIKKIRYANLG